MRRRPSALVPPQLARLAGYALLAAIGSLQWIRYVDGASTRRAVGWVLAGVLAGLLVLAAGRLPGRRRAAALAAAVVAGVGLALAASGLDLTYLEPNHLDELGAGLGRGLEALNSVRLPYLGREPWVLRTVELSGAGLCWAAAALACWPRSEGNGTRILALVLLLILAAAPIVSLGADRPALLGLGLAVMTAAFLWLERLARRPGLGLAVLAAAAALVALPVGAAADREEPWFDYKAFSERLGAGPPVTFDWNHDYGPIDWPREGVELFRVRSKAPHYWKAETLNTFDGRQWTEAVQSTAGDTPADDLPAGRRHREWDTSFSVDLRRLKTRDVIGAGTTLAVRGATRPVEPAVVPGQWVTSGTAELAEGDSYDVRANIPDPRPAELAAATVGEDPRRAGALEIGVDIRPDAVGTGPLLPSYPHRGPQHADSAEIAFKPFETGKPPEARYPRLGITGPGASVLRGSYYARTWALSQRLRRGAKSPYDYLLRVNGYLRDPDFAYTEVPPPVPDSQLPLDFFINQSKLGYCQQFSGAMTLLLRMGGIPARVATGFSPGGLRSTSGEWVVRDTDAHSWVEAWFDGLGWVTFDPTPSDTPARSQIAAIAPPVDDKGGPDSVRGTGTDPRVNRRPGGLQQDVVTTPETGGGGRSGGGGPWGWVAGGGAALALLLALVGLAVRRGRPRTPETALAELERALRRSGRSPAPGTTLAELERRLGTAGDGYLRALRAARFAPAAPPPSPRQRAELRRELASGLGWSGRLRALYALPPAVTLGRRRPS